MNTSNPTLIIDMKSSEILYQLQDLREIWRKQSFTFSNDQQKKYDQLKEMRSERIKFMYENNMVYKSGASK